MTLPLNQVCFLTQPNTNDLTFVLGATLGGETTGVDFVFYAGVTTQSWVIQPAESGVYQIVNQANAWVLDGNSTGGVSVSEKSTAVSQMWFIDDLGNGSYGIRNRASGLSLWGSPESGEVLITDYEPSKTTWKQWAFLTHLPNAIPANTTCVLAHYSDPNQAVMVLQEQSPSDLATASYNGSSTQLWQFTDVGQGFFNIVSLASGRVLDGDPQGNIRVNTLNPNGTASAAY